MTVDTKQTVRQELEQLKKQAEKHNRLYYGKDSPEITDYEYDALVKRISEIERLHPELASADSPSKKVSGVVSAHFQPVRHLKRMLSIDNISAGKSDGEDDGRPGLARAFDARVSKAAGQSQSYVAQLKFDGVSASVLYEGGKLVRAATRGDGLVGEDITKNIETIKSVPKKIKGKSSLPDVVEVRGEVMILLSDFKRLNKEITSSQGTAFANPRNAAAGSLRQTDPQITASRPLLFFAWGVGYFSGVDLPTEMSVASSLAEWGFQTGFETQFCPDIEKAIEVCRDFERQRETLAYDADGVVIKVNDRAVHETVGETAKYPRWCSAYKFLPRHCSTVLKQITVQVGRTGILTPVAELEPVNIGGVTVKRASLHNSGFINDKDIRLGDTVVVRRAGDVIPEVAGVVKEKRSAACPAFRWPSSCPSCGSSVAKDEDGANFICLNADACPSQLKQAVLHAASRGVFNIKGLGRETVSALVDGGIAKDIADVFALTKEDFLRVEGFAEKSSTELEKEIREKTKKVRFAVFIEALGIRGVGSRTAELLASRFGSVEQFFSASCETLASVNGIGEKTAREIKDFQQSQTGMRLKEKLLNTIKDIDCGPQQTEARSGISGKTFVITGRLETKRDDIARLIKLAGGNVSSAVSSKTDCLVCGVEPGSKLGQAQRLEVPVISEGDLNKMLGIDG